MLNQRDIVSSLTNARWEIWKEIDEDKPKIFNLVFNSLSRVSEEIIKGNLGEDFDIIRTESDIQTLWNCIINTHNNGAVD